MSKENLLYDVRVINRHIEEGSLTKKDYKTYLKELPDSKEKSETLQIEEEITEEQVEEIEQAD